MPVKIRSLRVPLDIMQAVGSDFLSSLSFAYNCAPYQKILKADKAEKEAAVADEPKKGNRRSCDPDNDQLANDCRSKYHNACLLKYACIDSRFNRSSNFAAEFNFLQAT